MDLVTLYLVLIALGIGAGFMAGLLGIGGGMILVPFLTALLTSQAVGASADLGVKMAIATSMATIVFTSASSVYAHQRRGALRWDLVKLLAPGIVVGSLIASAGVFSLLKGRWLAAGFGVFVAYSAIKMLQARKAGTEKPLPGPGGLAVAGGSIGFLSGMVGAGGGFISVPYMANRGVSMHTAVATSAALGFPIALTNVAGYIWSGLQAQGLPSHSLGYVWLPALGTIAVCSMMTAPFGAKAAHALPVQKLKRIFACLLLLLSAYMLYKAVRG